MKKFLFLLLIAVFILTSCFDISSFDLENKEFSVLKVKFVNEYRKTLEPDSELTEISYYTIEGDGPGESSFFCSFTDLSEEYFEIKNLKNGVWEISAQALNQNGQIIAIGSENVELTPGENLISIYMAQSSEKSSINLEYNIPVYSEGMYVKSSIFDKQGNLVASDSGILDSFGKCIFAVNDIISGYYKLEAFLYDSDDNKVGGVVEAVHLYGGIDLDTSKIIQIEESASADIEIIIPDFSPVEFILKYSKPNLYVSFDEKYTEEDKSYFKVHWYEDGQEVYNLNNISLNLSGKSGTVHYDAIIEDTKRNILTSRGITFKF